MVLLVGALPFAMVVGERVVDAQTTPWCLWGGCVSARAGVTGLFCVLNPGGCSVPAIWELLSPGLYEGPWKARGHVVLPHSPGQEVLAAAGEQCGHCWLAPAARSAARP